MTRLTSVGSGVACGPLPTFLNAPDESKKHAPSKKHIQRANMNESMSRYIFLLNMGISQPAFLGMCIFGVVAATTREAYIVPCGNLKSNLNDPEWGQFLVVG